MQEILFYLQTLRHREDVSVSIAILPDYSNLQLFGCLAIAKLQFKQKTAAHSILDTQCLCPSKRLLWHLHWLPIHFSIS